MNAQRSGWVFTRNTDLAVFWAPMLAGGVLFYGLGLSRLHPSFLSVFIGVLVLDLAHIFSSGYPTLRLSFDGRASHWRTYFIPAVICAAWLMGYRYAQPLTLSILAYVAIFHLIRQQFGWVMISRKKFSDPFPRWLDTVMVWNQLIAPFMFWNSELSEAPKVYYTPDDFHLLLPAGVALAALAIYWLINLLYFVELFRKKYPINAGKLSLIGVTAVIFYVPMVLERNNLLWFLLFVPAHAISYMIYSWRATAAPYPSPSIAGRRLMKLNHPVAYMIILFAISAALVPQLKGLRTPQYTEISPFVAIPLLLHYYFDSYIWLSRYRLKA